MEKSLKVGPGPQDLARKLVLGSDRLSGSLPVVRAFCETSPEWV